MNRFLAFLVAALAASAAAAAPPTETVPWSSGVPISYDGSGNIVQVGNDAFYYDNVSRLVQAKVNNDQRTYEYDAFGNRQKCIPSSGGDCQNGFSMQKSDNHITGVEYIGGNVTKYAGIGYAYDDVNMLARDDPPSGLYHEYIYDADDQRLAIYTAGGSWNWSVRDTKGSVLREFASNDGPQGLGTSGWKWSRDYVYRDGLLLASRQPVTSATPASTSTYHYHLDQIGTPRRVTDNSDQTIGFHDYYAFGPEIGGGLTESNPAKLKFTGQERDTGPAGDSYDTLDYLHARYYSATLAHFFSVDPERKSGRTSAPQSWNRYTYARNNPLRLVDPDGKDPKEFRVLTVRINVVYSNADVKINNQGQTLRQVTEEGIAYSRTFFVQAGIKLDVRRFEGTINTEAWGNINGPVKTSSGDVSLSDFMKSQKNALNVLVSADFGGVTGKTAGVGGPTIIGNAADKMVFNDEMGHALGNVTIVDVPLVSNTLADIRMDLQETFVEWGWSLSPWYDETFRKNAEKLNGSPQ
jgi:RHS repeat-associated protein